GGSEVPAALYWRARLAEEEGDLETARAWYVKCAQRFRNYYYGLISRERLAQLKGPVNVAAVAYPILDAIPEPKPLSEEAAVTEPPSDDLAAEKSKLLVNAGLTDFAVKELQAVEGGTGANWATLQIARIHQDAGQHHRAVQFLKRAVPSYYSLEIAELPRAYWDLLFPTPYWTDLQRFAEMNSLDPYLVASLIRQESEFNPKALSHANAWGLMQLLPTVGRGEARELRLRGFSTDSLVDPKINMQLGTRYFREMIEHYNGQVEYALAAYNAGSNRVDDWLANGKFRDVPEFVETIPFTETREYVQAIMRNAQVYKALYPQESRASVAGSRARTKQQ
ncbi:MAG TPA: lytic transglycosylase domain-containing protein, partial [Clostridia bacterium]|nr:lytic transglycosylase domain-containing protein [Clostridia bacterium]